MLCFKLLCLRVVPLETTMVKNHSHLDFQLLLSAVLKFSVVLKTEQNSHIGYINFLLLL